MRICKNKNFNVIEGKMYKTIDLECHHQLGSHCSTTAIRTLLKYKGINMSEEMIFGLGSGLGFTYIRQSNNYMFGGRGGNIEFNIASAIGADIEVVYNEDANSAWEYSKKKLIQNEPQIIDADMQFLNYLKEKINIGKKFSFGGHKLLLIGFNEDKHTAYILDYLWSRIIEININELKMARSSMCGDIPSNNMSISIIVPSEIYPLEVAISESIKYNVQQMNNPVGFGLGLKALKRFFKEIRIWPEILEKERLQLELYKAYTVFEKIGTGGGNFRRMYSRFLKQSAHILSSNMLFEISDIYVQLGRMWKEYSAILLNASMAKNIKEHDIFNCRFVDSIESKILEYEYLGVRELQKELMKG